MRRHVSAVRLARFCQGDLSPRRRARIAAHLSRCSRCTRLSEDLGGVSTLLASVSPPPMPEHLTTRIQAALATEAARKVALPAGSKPAAAAAGGGAAGPAGPADGRGPRHELARRGWRPRLPSMTPRVALGAVAAVAVVVVGVGMYEVVSSSSSSPSSSSAAAPSGVRPASGASAQPTRGPALRYRHGAQNATITPISSGTDFTASKLSVQVAAQVSKYGPGSTVAGPMTHSQAAPAGRPATFAHMAVSALQGCVNRIAAGDLVVLVEIARYQGSPAAVIVTEVAQAAPQKVWVVGLGCSASRSDMLERSALSAAG
jgi:Putative zinc-finger